MAQGTAGKLAVSCGVSRSCRRWRKSSTRSRRSSRRIGAGHRRGLRRGLRRGQHRHVTQIESEILQTVGNQDDSHLVEGGARSFISRSFEIIRSFWATRTPEDSSLRGAESDNVTERE